MRVHEILVIFGTWYLLFADYDWFLASVVALMMGVLIFVTRSLMKAERNIRRLSETSALNTDSLSKVCRHVYGDQFEEDLIKSIEQQREDMKDAS